MADNLYKINVLDSSKTLIYSKNINGNSVKSVIYKVIKQNPSLKQNKYIFKINQQGGKSYTYDNENIYSHYMANTNNDQYTTLHGKLLTTEIYNNPTNQNNMNESPDLVRQKRNKRIKRIRKNPIFLNIGLLQPLMQIMD